MDLKEFDASLKRQQDGISVNIKHPATGEETGMIIVVASYESEKTKEQARRIADVISKKQEQNPGYVPNFREVESNTLAIAVAAIVGWTGIQLDGKDLEFTPSNVSLILKKYSFIADQIDKTAGDRALFFGK